MSAEVHLHVAHLVARSHALPSVNSFHELLHRGWPDTEPRRYLFRADRKLHASERFRVVSFLVTVPVEHQPDWDKAAFDRPGTFVERKVHEFRCRLQEGDRYQFFCRGNTSKRRHFDAPGAVADDAPSAAKRPFTVEVAKTHRERVAWLAENAAQSGFALETEPLTSNTLPYVVSQVDRGIQVPLYPCDFQGILRVEDPAVFAETLRTGLRGCRGRVYGHGMVAIRRLP